MTKNQSLIFRGVLFVFGIGIIALAFNLINAGADLTKIDKFTWFSVVVMYLVFFCPFFFSSITINNFSGKIPHLALVWTGIALYLVASFVVIRLVRSSTISFNTAVIIQAVLVFVFAIDVYFAYFASSHARDVAGEEASKRHYLSEIKSKAASLALAAGSLPSEYEQVQKTIRAAADDIRYLSPVDHMGALDVELEILSTLDTLSLCCDAVARKGQPMSFEEDARKLQTLVKQRKLVRN
jgi:hypothetical protein